MRRGTSTWQVLFFLPNAALLRTCVAAVAAAASASSGAATAAARLGTTSSARPGLVSLPLIPHHEYQERQRRHLAQWGRRGMGTTTGADGSVDRASWLFQARLEAELYRSHYRRGGDENAIWDELRALQETTNASTSTTPPPPASHSNMQVAALFQGFGTHYADLWCGTPPQRQTVIVDTGSGVTAFPCSGCGEEACGVPKYHIDGLWTESQSSTYQKLGCNECLRGHCSGGDECSIVMSYQEGSSWTAHEVQDKCYVGGLHDLAIATPTGVDDMDPHHASDFAFDLKFGCQTHLTGLFKTQLADGIMGMDSADASFWSQMSKALSVKREFSLCFSRSPTASRQGTPAGAMTLGGFDERLHQTDMLFTGISAGRGFYNVHLRKVYLREGSAGDSALSTKADAKIITLAIDEGSLNQGSVIVDSGTTDTYFNQAIARPFANAWKDMMGTDYDHRPVVLTDEQLHALPTILFQIVGDVTLNKQVADFNEGNPVAGLAGVLDPDNPYDVILAIPASHFYEYDEDSQDYTARFYTDERGGSVLGANAMMGHDVYFDVDNNRIGWAESNCDYTSLVQPYLNADTTDTTRNQVPNEDTNNGSAESTPQTEPESTPQTEPATAPVGGEDTSGNDSSGSGGGGEDSQEGTVEEAGGDNGGTPSEDESAEPPSEDESAEPPSEDESAEIPSEDESAEPPSEDESAEPPSEDESAEPPSEDEGGEIPGGDEGSESKSNDEGSEDKYDDSVETPEEAKSSSSSSGAQVCSSSGCRGGTLIGLALVVVAGLAIVRRRRRRMTAVYEMAASELELQTRGSTALERDEEGGFSNVKYRDAIPQYHGYTKAPESSGIYS